MKRMPRAKAFAAIVAIGFVALCLSLATKGRQLLVWETPVERDPSDAGRGRSGPGQQPRSLRVCRYFTGYSIETVVREDAPARTDGRAACPWFLVD